MTANVLPAILFGVPAALASIKAAIDLYNAGGDRSLPCLEFHTTDHLWTGLNLWIDFPVPPRRWVLLNVKINATMLHDRPLLVLAGKRCVWA